MLVIDKLCANVAYLTGTRIVHGGTQPQGGEALGPSSHGYCLGVVRASFGSRIATGEGNFGLGIGIITSDRDSRASAHVVTGIQVGSTGRTDLCIVS
jgi:hypothetical protein